MYSFEIEASYARILVEVDVTKPLTREVFFKLPNGRILHQKVDYKYEPKLCEKFHFVGHVQENCKAKRDKRRGRSKSRTRMAKQDDNEYEPMVFS